MSKKISAKLSKSSLACCATGAFFALIAGSRARAASTVDLTITANNGVWDAYVNVQDPATLGLAGIQFDVTGNGILLNTVSNKLPTGAFTDTSGSTVSSGFVLLRSATTAANDSSVSGAQSLTYDNEDSNTPAHDNLAKGFGLTGVSSGNVGDQVKTWGDPALLATGTYTGNGTITISGDQASISLLPGTLPPDTSPIVTHSPDSVSAPETVAATTASTPEPTSIALAGIAALGLLASRRRVMA